MNKELKSATTLNTFQNLLKEFDRALRNLVIRTYRISVLKNIFLIRRDKILPCMETLINADDRVASELDKLGRLVDLSSSSSNEGASERNKFECQTPFLCNEFQSARLFLSHIGCISVEGLQVIFFVPLLR